MELLTDDCGNDWRVTGDSWQVTVQKRAPLTEKEQAEGVLLEDKMWRPVSYHGRLDHALTWLLDYFVREGLEDLKMDQLHTFAEEWRQKIQHVAEYWRQSIKKSVYSD